jgi:hypothetical protein
MQVTLSTIILRGVQSLENREVKTQKELETAATLTISDPL